VKEKVWRERTRAKERKGKTENNNIRVALWLFLGSEKPCRISKVKTYYAVSMGAVMQEKSEEELLLSRIDIKSSAGRGCEEEKGRTGKTRKTRCFFFFC